jgi:hypothetical protein
MKAYREISFLYLHWPITEAGDLTFSAQPETIHRGRLDHIVRPAVNFIGTTLFKSRAQISVSPEAKEGGVTKQPKSFCPQVVSITESTAKVMRFSGS